MATTHYQSQQYRHIALAIVLCIVALLSTLDGQGTAWAGKPGPITIQPFKAVQAMQMKLELRVDGKTTANKLMRGSLSLDSQYNKSNNQRKFAYSGSLVSTLYSANPQMKSMNLTGITLYRLNKTNYVMLKGKKTMCYPTPEDSTQFLQDQYSAENLINTLHLGEPQGSLIGVPIAEETRNGVKAVRYRLDAKATTARMNTTSGLSMTVISGLVWVSKSDNHLVRFEAVLQGAIPYFLNNDGFNGRMTTMFDFSRINEPIEITLPKSCTATSFN